MRRSPSFSWSFPSLPIAPSPTQCWPGLTESRATTPMLCRSPRRRSMKTRLWPWGNWCSAARWSKAEIRTEDCPILKKSCRLEPGNLEAHLTLAKAYSKLGRKDDARRERLLCLELSGGGARPVPLRNSLQNSLQVYLLFLCCLSAVAQSKQAAATCATCHPAQASMQPETQMGRAMELPANNSTLRTHPKLTFQSAGYTYTVETRDGQSRYTVSDGAHEHYHPNPLGNGLPGADLGARAQRQALREPGQLLSLDQRPRHSPPATTSGILRTSRRPSAARSAMRRQKSCFGCHATNAVVDHKLNLAAVKPGVTCEHCHVGATAHFSGIVQGDMSSVPPKLGKLSSEDLSNFCGKCHRSWETVVRSHWRGQSDVRFQPYRLANSKCFDGTDPRIKLHRLPRSSPEAGARFPCLL